VSAGQVRGQRFRSGGHEGRESPHPRRAKPNRHPTEVGRQVSWGWRQSIPDRR
jgi:hypothetical protein